MAALSGPMLANNNSMVTNRPGQKTAGARARTAAMVKGSEAMSAQPENPIVSTMQPITSPATEKPHASTPTWPGTESRLLRTAEERPRSILANAAGGRPCPSQSVVIEIAPPDRTAERTLPPRRNRSASAAAGAGG